MGDAGLRSQLKDSARKQISGANAVIISDYNYGVADAHIVASTRDAAQGNIPLLADSRFRLGDFAGFTSATPNQDEVEQLLGKKFTQLAELEIAGEELRERLGFRALLITRGSNGMSLLEEGMAPVQTRSKGDHGPVAPASGMFRNKCGHRRPPD